MAQYIFNTKRKKASIRIEVMTKSKQRIRIIAKDWKKPFTKYTDRWMDVEGSQVFLINMPQSSDNLKILVFNNKNGLDDNDKTYKVVKIESIPFRSKFSIADIPNQEIREFIYFAQHFSENAGILSTGVYFDDSGKFRINYMTVIRDEKGSPHTTPCRVSTSNYAIDVAQSIYKNYTVPMRIAILFHEFCHVFVNRNQANETEADLNSLLMYLGIGYPYIEAHKAWLDVFYYAPTDSNGQRYKIIKNFIANFDKLKIDFKKFS